MENKLSEEEIIIECNKLLITLNNSHIDGKIIQILYDLYNKEKKKNEELSKNFNELYKTAHNDFEERCRLAFKLEERESRLQEEINEACKLKTELYGNSISKDKIIEKIKELEEFRDENEKTKFILSLSFYNSIDNEIYDLKELLEEN